MHYGSKGWYVEELKKVGVRKDEGRKVERLKRYLVGNVVEEKKGR
nr:DUF2639 domain-containing protein [Bacillus pumilus]